MTRGKRLLLYKILLALFALLLVLLPAAKNPVPEIDMRVLVTVIGLDKTEKGLKASAEIMIPMAEGEGQLKQEVASAEGLTVSEALDQLNIALGRRVELGHCGLIVVGHKLAEEDVLPHLKYLLSSGKISAGVNVVTTEKISAAEFIEKANNLSEASSSGVNNFIEYANRGAHVSTISLLKFLNCSYCESGAIYMPCIEIQEKLTEEDQSKKDGSGKEGGGGQGGESGGSGQTGAGGDEEKSGSQSGQGGGGQSGGGEGSGQSGGGSSSDSGGSGGQSGGDSGGGGQQKDSGSSGGESEGGGSQGGENPGGEGGSGSSGSSGGGESGGSGGELSGGGSSPSQSEIKSVESVVVFQGGKRVKKLDRIPTRGVAWVDAKSDKGLMLLEDAKVEGKSIGPISGRIKSKKIKYKAAFADGMPQLTFRLTVAIEIEDRHRLTEFWRENGMDDRVIYGALREDFSDKIRGEIEAAVDEMRRINCDIVAMKTHFNRFLHKDYVRYKQARPNEFLTDLRVKYEIKIKLR